MTIHNNYFVNKHSSDKHSLDKHSDNQHSLQVNPSLNPNDNPNANIHTNTNINTSDRHTLHKPDDHNQNNANIINHESDIVTQSDNIDINLVSISENSEEVNLNDAAYIRVNARQGYPKQIEKPSDTQTEIFNISNNSNSLEFNSLDSNSLILNQIIVDASTHWQIHNCKIIDKTLTQSEKLPFIYHYDALDEEIKSLHPLEGQLLKQFQTPMFANEAAQHLHLSEDLIKIPWQIKVTGTLVMFCETLQIALRLKFTNTAKQRDPVYTEAKEDALLLSMKKWHFYGNVFVLNKNSRPLIIMLEDEWMSIPRLDDYQALPASYSAATLALLEAHIDTLPQLDEAIKIRLI